MKPTICICTNQYQEKERKLVHLASYLDANLFYISNDSNLSLDMHQLKYCQKFNNINQLDLALRRQRIKVIDGVGIERLPQIKKHYENIIISQKLLEKVDTGLHDITIPIFESNEINFQILEFLVREFNAKIYSNLPVGNFCCEKISGRNYLNGKIVFNIYKNPKIFAHEALSCGIPIVCSNSKSALELQEIYKENVCLLDFSFPIEALRRQIANCLTIKGQKINREIDKEKILKFYEESQVEEKKEIPVIDGKITAEAIEEAANKLENMSDCDLDVLFGETKEINSEVVEVPERLHPLLNRTGKTYFIIPYSFFGGGEIYLYNHLKDFKNKIVFLFLSQNTEFQKRLVREGFETVCSPGTAGLSSYLLKNKISEITFYNSRNVSTVLNRLKKVNSRLRITEIVHSIHKWADSMHNTVRPHIDRIVCVSETVAKQWNIEKFEVCKCVCDKDRFSKENLEKVKVKLEKSGIKCSRENRHEIRIGTVCRLSPEKNLMRVLEIASRVSDKFKFIICGADGGIRTQLVSAINRRGLAKKVLVKPYNENIEEEYLQFDGFLLTSTAEGTPLTILEAKEVGMPVFASDVGAVREMLGENDYCFSLTESDDIVASEIMKKFSAIEKSEKVVEETIEKAVEVVERVKTRQELRREEKLKRKAEKKGEVRKPPSADWNPLVSFYMPSYNCGKYIKQAIDSILNQTYKNIEICICNDGSIDNTLEVLEEYREEDKRVRWISQENKGIGSASNVAIRMCQGEIIAQLDADDWIEPEAIEEVLKVYKENRTLIGVYTDYNLVDENGIFIKYGYGYPEFDQKVMLTRNIIHPLRTFRKDIWELTEGANENIKNAVDYDIQLKLCDYGLMKHLSKKLYNYRQHNKSTTQVDNLSQAQNSHIVIRETLQRRKLPYDIIFNPHNPFLINLEFNQQKVEDTKVSVIMTAHNTEEYIERAVESILSQTHKNIELIVVDDCSTDKTLDILKEIKDDRLQIYKAKKNSGTYCSKNFGITMATGAYITFQDSDDISNSERVEKQLQALFDPSCNLSNCLYQRVGSNMMSKQFFCCISAMFPIRFIKRLGFFDSVRIAADSEFLYRFSSAICGKSSLNNAQAKILDECLYLAPIRSTGLTQQYEGGKSLRKQYAKDFNLWHTQIRKRGASPYMNFPQTERAFETKSQEIIVSSLDLEFRKIEAEK